MKEQFMPSPEDNGRISTELEITSEDIKKEQERIQGVIAEYMNEDPGSRIASIKEAIISGDKETAIRLKEEALENLDAQITFIRTFESEDLKKMENKLRAVFEYYEQKF